MKRRWFLKSLLALPIVVGLAKVVPPEPTPDMATADRYKRWLAPCQRGEPIDPITIAEALDLPDDDDLRHVAIAIRTGELKPYEGGEFVRHYFYYN